MLKKRMISLVLTLIMTASLCIFDHNTVVQKANASTDSSSILDTPFETTTDGSAKVTIDKTKFMVGGKELWLNGTNAPWIYWNDFGATSWDGKSTFNETVWDQHFKQLHDNGINAARVWISCNGDVGMKINKDGSFDGATEQYWKDIDKLVKIAEKYQIYLMATVQSFDHYKNSNNTYQSWRKLIQDKTKTDQYIDKFIVPLVKRYDSSDYFWSVDLCNEPDWIVENAECGKLSWDSLCNYYAKASAAIHKNSDVMVTLGLAMIKYNSTSYGTNVISDANLQAITKDKASYMDFYSTHWYAWQKQYFGFPFDKTPKEFKLDGTKPSVIGECAATTSSNDSVTLTDKYKKAYENGWNGVFAWKSSGSDDGCGLLKDISPATNAMLDIAKDKIFPLTTTLQSISGYTAKLSATTFSYTGTILKPSVTVADGVKTLVEGTDFSVKYSNNKLPGTAKVTITGIRNYEGSISKTFKIKFDAPVITLSAGTKKATMKWNKITGASGYEVRMATSKSGSYSLIKDAAGSSTSYTNTNMISGKTYYIKVRAYIKNNGKKIYSAYSVVKTVAVK